MDEELQALTEALKQKGDELTQKRFSTAEKLSPLINEELHDLGIPHGRFCAQITSPLLNKNGNTDV